MCVSRCRCATCADTPSVAASAISSPCARRSRAFPASAKKKARRGREDGVGVGGAAGRLIELCERERREQFVAPRAPLLGDGYCGQVGILGERRIAGIGL